MTSRKDLKAQLVKAYDADAQRRKKNADSKSQWKLTIREKFVDLIQKEGKTTILELGAGAGTDSVYFQNRGFDILATDISPKMVETCKQNGLNATVLDLYELSKLKQQFDAVYSMNVLLHIPEEDLTEILAAIHKTLTPGGIFFYGVYGGINKETVLTDPTRMNLPRFFSFLDDDKIERLVSPYFEIVSKDFIDIGDGESGFDLHFQSLLLKKV